MRELAKYVLGIAFVAFAPAAAYAQGSIVGLVKDASGAVLPGVTVEAASPALIEKVRSVVTDGTGQYRIQTLRPGTYTVTFTLPGFSTVKREGIELTGAFVATVNADLRVGSIEETLTVTGATPIVDVQSTTRQRVMDREILDNIPSGRTQYNLGVLIPGVVLTGGQDVGGSGGQTAFPALEIHGSKASDSVETMGGMSISVLNTGSHQPVRVNPAGTQEIVLDTASGDAEYTVGGVRINRIPREGSNTFNATFFGALANGGMQGNNLTQKLRDRGLGQPDSINTNWEANVGFGGPIKRDKFWFYFAARKMRSSMYAAGLYWNKNLNNPNAWTYEPDLSYAAGVDKSLHESAAVRGLRRRHLGRQQRLPSIYPVAGHDWRRRTVERDGVSRADGLFARPARTRQQLPRRRVLYHRRTCLQGRYDASKRQPTRVSLRSIAADLPTQ